MLAVILILSGFMMDDQNGLRNEFIAGGAILLITVLLIDAGGFLIENRKRLKLVFQCKWVGNRNQYVRFSMSYQYLIKVNDKYLLVKNSNKNWNWYQHVGGKYKRLEETKKVLQDLKATDDPKMKTDGLKKGDLAVFIPIKNALKFLDWFDSNKEREISHWREFYEELIGGKSKTQILSHENFPYINYRFIDTVRTPLKKAPIESGWDCWEILQYDVLELILTTEQEKELTELQEQGDTDYIKWADAELINRLGYDSGQKERRYEIGPHTKWILNLKWSKS